MKPSYIHTMTAYTGRQSNRGHRQTLYSRWANEIFTYVIFPSTTASISMALVLMHWSYVFLALTHRFGLWNSHDPDLWHIFGSTNFTNGFLAHKLKSCQKKKNTVRSYCWRQAEGGAMRFLVVGTISIEETPPQGYQLWIEQCLTYLKYWPVLYTIWADGNCI